MGYGIDSFDVILISGHRNLSAAFPGIGGNQSIPKILIPHSHPFERS